MFVIEPFGLHSSDIQPVLADVGFDSNWYTSHFYLNPSCFERNRHYSICS